MKNKRIFLFIGLIMFLVVGCSSAKKENSNVQVFNLQTAKSKAEQYVLRLKNGDIDGANEISTPELAVKNKKKNIGDMKITSFITGEGIEVGNSAYIEMIVVRSEGDKPNCNLDKLTLKIVNQESGEYKVSEINVETMKQLFVDGDSLKIISSDTGISEVVMTKNDIPNQITSKEESEVLNKINVPKNNYGTLGISPRGGKVALTTNNGKDSFIALALIEDAKVTMGSVVGDLRTAQEKSIDENTLRKIFDKPIAQQIVGYDVLKDTKIKEIIFTEEEDQLIVQYNKGNNPNVGMKIYSNPDGKPFKADFEKLFPIDKYSVEYIATIKSDILIRVKKGDNAKEISQELLGEYVINTDEETVNKI